MLLLVYPSPVDETLVSVKDTTARLDAVEANGCKRPAGDEHRGSCSYTWAGWFGG